MENAPTDAGASINIVDSNDIIAQVSGRSGLLAGPETQSVAAKKEEWIGKLFLVPFQKRSVFIGNPAKQFQGNT